MRRSYQEEVDRCREFARRFSQLIEDELAPLGWDIRAYVTATGSEINMDVDQLEFTFLIREYADTLEIVHGSYSRTIRRRLKKNGEIDVFPFLQRIVEEVLRERAEYKVRSEHRDLLKSLKSQIGDVLGITDLSGWRDRCCRSVNGIDMEFVFPHANDDEPEVTLVMVTQSAEQVLMLATLYAQFGLMNLQALKALQNVTHKLDEYSDLLIDTEETA